MIENEEVQQKEMVMQGPGQILKQARVLANFTIQDIAEKMKLKKSLIEDIEQDNYDTSISLTFVRGYLKLYAKHVKVAEVDILNAFENLSTQKKEPAKLQGFSHRVSHQANDDKLMLVTYLIVAAVIALVVIWWIQQSSFVIKTESVASNNPEAVTQDMFAQGVLPLEKTLTPDSDKLILTPLDAAESTNSSGVRQSNVRLPLVIEDQSVNNQSVDEEDVDDTSTLAEGPYVGESMATELVTPVELIFKFSGDCWMNLSDATGENIAYGVKVKGRVMPVTGIPPFIVTLGAPEVVKISYAGESLNMSFLPSGRIAKFDLPLSE
jgi:cytoskeleton protein RodZ